MAKDQFYFSDFDPISKINILYINYHETVSFHTVLKVKLAHGHTNIWTLPRWPEPGSGYAHNFQKTIKSSPYRQCFWSTPISKLIFPTKQKKSDCS